MKLNKRALLSEIEKNADSKKVLNVLQYYMQYYKITFLDWIDSHVRNMSIIQVCAYSKHLPFAFSPVFPSIWTTYFFLLIHRHSLCAFSLYWNLNANLPGSFFFCVAALAVLLLLFFICLNCFNNPIYKYFLTFTTETLWHKSIFIHITRFCI